jgi:hypothetical protein
VLIDKQTLSDVAHDALSKTSRWHMTAGADYLNSPISLGTQSEGLWLLEQFADLCVAETVRLQENSQALGQRLNDAYNLLNATAASGNGKSKNLRRVWLRQDPRRLFAKDGEERLTINKDELHGAVATYLARPYLRHPTFDWILLDMTITGELLALGDYVKHGWLASFLVGRSHRRMRALWYLMHEVWTRLAPPVINPRLVRDLMVKTTNQGAAWDTAPWSLIDRAIAVDPSALIVEQRGLYPTITRCELVPPGAQNS